MKYFGLLAALAMTLPQNAIAQVEDNEFADSAEVMIRAKIDADTGKIVTGLNQFSSEYYSQITTEKGDIAFSPASIATAFGLAYAGARGETATDIAKTLHYPTDIADFHKSYGQLLGTMQIDAKGRTMAVNNAIWLQHGLPVRDEYLALVDRNYAAGLQRVNFKGDPDAARLAINTWVEGNTNDKIKNLLHEPDITAGTRSVLVNTVYFKADWAQPFDKAKTKNEKFKLSDGKAVEIPLMNQRDSFAGADKNGVQLLSMPYRGGEAEMIFLLPKAGQLAKLEKQIAVEGLEPWLATFDNDDAIDGDTILTIPKFKIERRYDNVRDQLEALEMVRPFQDNADFTAMKPVNLGSKDPNDWNLAINKVIHQVLVEVEEKGTEAAAATAIGMIVTSGALIVKPRPPRIFRADHPFIFVIRDWRTKAILFVGRFTGESAISAEQ